MAQNWYDFKVQSYDSNMKYFYLKVMKYVPKPQELGNIEKISILIFIIYYIDIKKSFEI